MRRVCLCVLNTMLRQVVYEGFDTGTVLPSAQALTEQGTNPTFVNIGLVSFGGQATVNSGLIGTIRFRTLAAFSSSAIRLARGELARSGQIESMDLNLRVELQPELPKSFALSLDVNNVSRAIKGSRLPRCPKMRWLLFRYSAMIWRVRLALLRVLNTMLRRFPMRALTRVLYCPMPR